MKKTLAAGSLLIAAFALTGKEPESTVIAHEWGTFTSVALDTGAPARWAPWNGAPDLPCFVYREALLVKGALSGTIRMETPVIYFYANRPETVSVQVDFPKGTVTEWYPQALAGYGINAVARKGISWEKVQILPNTKAELPRGSGTSHYYAARETDAALLRVGEEQESLLFYRGVGDFVPQLGARYPGDGKLELRNTYQEPIPLAIAFENQGNGKVGYSIVRNLENEASIDPPQVTQDVKTLHAELQRELVAAGIYQKEAAAMIETWRDSWFEEGTRVFYIMPQAAVDRVLPLQIKPAPAQIARVFVGRVEVLSPWSRQTIATANAARDVPTLMKFGRFLDPFGVQMQLKGSGSLTAAQNQLAANVTATGGCVK